MTEDPLTRYERLADEFHKATGLMAPGKDDPMSDATMEERQRLWNAWLILNAKAPAWGLLGKYPAGTSGPESDAAAVYLCECGVWLTDDEMETRECSDGSGLYGHCPNCNACADDMTIATIKSETERPR